MQERTLSSEHDPRDDVLISVEQLFRERESSRPPVVLDVRWRLDHPDGRDEYEAGHIPGAIYVSLDDELASRGAPTDGRHPLPQTADLQTAARRWGIHRGDPVVVADDLNALSAARAWWLLVAAGIPNVRILDGGYRAWAAAGLPVATGAEPAPDLGDIVLDEITRSPYAPILALDEVAAFAQRGVLIDARAAERYRGETEPIDPRAGHIPGAVNRPTTENLDRDGRFLPTEELIAAFAEKGVHSDTRVAVYCGSGVTAAHEIAALTIAGHRPLLYPGSWSQWSNHPELPVARGAEAGGHPRD